MQPIRQFSLSLLLGLVGALAANAQGRPTAYTEASAVRRALTQGPAAAVARDDRDLALIQARQARPRFEPDVHFSAAQRGGGPKIRLRSTRETVIPNAETTVALEIRQRLWQLGVGQAPSRRADALAAIARHNYRATLLDTALETRKAFYALLRAGDGVRIAQRGRRLAQRQLSLVELLEKRGRAAKNNRLVAARSLDEAQLDLGRARKGEQLAAANLKRLLGLPQGSPLPVQAKVAAVPPPPALSALLDRARASRPERLALTEAIHAAAAGIRLAKARRLPKISFEGGYTVNTPLAFVPRAFWTAGLRLDAPLFNKTVQRLDVRAARKELDRARNRLRQLDDAIALEVQSARISLAEAQARTALARKQLQAAEQALEIEFARFERGFSLDVQLESHRLAVARAASQVALGLYDQRVSQAELDRALGISPGLPAPPSKVARRSRARPRSQ